MRIIRFSLAILSAAAAALVFIALPRVLPLNIAGGSTLLPCLVLWWVVLRAIRLPHWWVVVLIVIVDAATFTPAGALTIIAFLVVGALHLLDRIVPQETFLHVMLRAAIAVALSIIGQTLVLWFPSDSLSFPWQSVARETTIGIATILVISALLWKIRQRLLRQWA
jgi:hypothetical protein